MRNKVWMYVNRRREQMPHTYMHTSNVNDSVVIVSQRSIIAIYDTAANYHGYTQHLHYTKRYLHHVL